MHLSDQLTEHFRLDRTHTAALKRLGIESVADLLYHLPVRYEDIANINAVATVEKGQETVVYGVVGGLKSRKAWKSRKPIAEGWIEDGSGKLKIMWFNQPYLAKMLKDGMYVKLAGTIAGSPGKLYLANPEIEKLDELPIDRHDSIFKSETGEETLYPVYRETKGVTSRWFYHTILKCFEKGVLEAIHDPIPSDILERYHLPALKTALVFAHSPKKVEHAEGARKRFAFEEIFYIQLEKARERAAVSAAKSYRVNTGEKHAAEFISRFPFPLTAAQKNAITDILKDLGALHPMSRLLEGDVGSGKTAVAATAAYAVATSRPEDGKRKTKNTRTDVDWGNLQVAYMAPTEILAKQHFQSFIEFFKHLPIQIGLITGSGCYKFPAKSNPAEATKISRAQLLKWVENGEIPILIGTHALIYKSVRFKHLALVIIDEQHRFGTNQRKALAKKDERLPHLLSMTATPIPRTLALTVYGDLDITLLDEMPAGRKPVKTVVVKPGREADMYQHLRDELAAGRQVYVICPRIDEPDPTKETALNAKSVIAEAERLKKTEFKTARIDLLHSKLTPTEKEAIMAQFLAHELDVLVATSVVEVGVNVPNATNIVIEGAERFGLSQLHQLRGRVLRGTHQPYCFLLTTSKSDKTRDRLKALTTAKNGFELAEFDLGFRGGGELYGGRQSGLTDLGMEALKNLKLVAAARQEAQALIALDPELNDRPLLKHAISKLNQNLHLE